MQPEHFKLLESEIIEIVESSKPLVTLMGDSQKEKTILQYAFRVATKRADFELATKWLHQIKVGLTLDNYYTVETFIDRIIAECALVAKLEESPIWLKNPLEAIKFFDELLPLMDDSSSTVLFTAVTILKIVYEEDKYDDWIRSVNQGKLRTSFGRHKVTVGDNYSWDYHLKKYHISSAVSTRFWEEIIKSTPAEKQSELIEKLSGFLTSKELAPYFDPTQSIIGELLKVEVITKSKEIKTTLTRYFEQEKKSIEKLLPALTEQFQKTDQNMEKFGILYKIMQYHSRLDDAKQYEKWARRIYKLHVWKEKELKVIHAGFIHFKQYKQAIRLVQYQVKRVSWSTHQKSEFKLLLVADLIIVEKYIEAQKYNNQILSYGCNCAKGRARDNKTKLTKLIAQMPKKKPTKKKPSKKKPTQKPLVKKDSKKEGGK